MKIVLSVRNVISSDHYQKWGGRRNKAMKEKIPIEIIVGKTYKNFKGNWRTVLAVLEESTATKVVYEDGTGLPRTCDIGTFRQWVKKNYY